MMHGRWFAPAVTHICCVVLAAGCVLMGGGGQPTRSWEFGQYQRLGAEQIEPETSQPVSGGVGWDINLVVKKIPLEEQASAVLEIEVTQ